MKLPLEITRGWENRFPDLYGKWTHWEISGDGYPIAIISGEKLIEAMKTIEENYGKFASIKACRAEVDELGNSIEKEEKHLYEISNYENDEKVRKRNET